MIEPTSDNRVGLSALAEGAKAPATGTNGLNWSRNEPTTDGTSRKQETDKKDGDERPRRRLSGSRRVCPVDFPSAPAMDQGGLRLEENRASPHSPPPRRRIPRRNSLTMLFRRRSSLTTAAGHDEEMSSSSVRVDEGAGAGTAANQRPIVKSCMSVKKLEDSLRSVNDPTPRERRQQRRSSLPVGMVAGDVEEFQVSNSAGPKLQRLVSFHEVEVRRYAVTLGDNPSVQRGPPVSLGWTYDPEHDVVPLDDFETVRSEQRRGPSQLKLNKKARMELLEGTGVSGDEMQRATQDVKMVKNQRIETLETLHHQPTEEVIERAKRHLKRLVTRTSAKEEQRKLWSDAQHWAGGRLQRYYDEDSEKNNSQEHNHQGSPALFSKTSDKTEES